jgi:acetolactate synthase-1/2/3 large subunit
MGMLGMHGTKASNLAVQECDLLIAVGARFDDRVTGKLNEFAPNAKVIHFDIDTAEINKRRVADASILGDLKVNLPALAIPLSIEPWKAFCLQMNADYAWDYNHPGETIFAPAVLKEISDKMPKNSCVTTDVGQHQMWAAQHMVFDDPSNFLTSAGMGTMGFGIPAAVGAQVSRPTNCIIAISGDGSFMMNVQELSTIKRFQLPVKIVLIDNAKLGMVRQWQDMNYEGRHSSSYMESLPDFVKLVEAYGHVGIRVTNRDELPQALEDTFNKYNDRLVFLDVKVDEKEHVYPMQVPLGSMRDMWLNKTERT